MKIIEYSKPGCIACAALGRMLKKACAELGIEYEVRDAGSSDKEIVRVPYTEFYTDAGLVYCLDTAFSRKQLEKIYDQYKEEDHAGSDDLPEHGT